MDSKTKNETSTLKYECKTCFETNKDNFYPYLTSKCIACKRKVAREKKQEILSEKRLEKLNDIDPDNKIRDVVEEVMKKDKVIENKSIFSFLSNVNSRIMDNEEMMDVKFNKVSSYFNELYKLIKQLQDENVTLRNELSEYKKHTDFLMSK